MKLNKVLTIAGIAVAVATAGNLHAQDQQGKDRQGRGGNRGGGNFDPAQFQQRMMEGVRDRLEIKDETEWKAMEPLVQKVMDARRESMAGSMRGMMGGRRPGGDNGGGNNGGGTGGGGGGRGFGGLGGEPSAEETALAKAVESKASKDDLKTKMAAYRKAKQAGEAKLKAAQDSLKKVLTVQQEAIALQMGLVQ